MKDLQCPYCRTPAKVVAVVSDGTIEASNARLDFQPGNLKVENKVLTGKLRHILDFPCPECDEEQKSYHSLKLHVQNQHEKTICDICTRQEYNFSDEYRVHEGKALKDHMRKQHVWCKYCRMYFYGTTEFSKHCKQTHMGCAICERRDPEHPVYCKNYDRLSEHYREKHYMCMVPSCLEDKHIVFGTVLELQKHMMDAHKGLMSSSRHGNQVDLGLVNRDAGEAQAPTSQGPSLNDGESEKVRYEARLDIAANHDQAKITMLRGANKTFVTKNVPIEIFIATYESVLKDVESTEITALLLAFKKAHGSSLREDAKRILSFQINLRARSEQATEREKASKRPESSGSTGSSSSQSSRHPSPQPISKINWGYSVPSSAGSLGNMANLPKLGSRPSVAAGGSSGSQQPIWTARQSSMPPIAGIRNLPTLAKKKNPYQQDVQPVRQTSIPLRQRTNYGGFATASNSVLDHYSNRSDHSTQSHLSASASTPTSKSASQTSLETSSSGTAPSAQGLYSRNLPKLPQKSQSDEKKRQRNVLRIV